MTELRESQIHILRAIMACSQSTGQACNYCKYHDSCSGLFDGFPLEAQNKIAAEARMLREL